MTMPMPLDQFVRLPRLLRAEIVDGLASALDVVAGVAAPSHRFLRHQWFAAALKAYGGQAQTLLVNAEQLPALALPIVSAGPAWLRVAMVPGSYWPFRSFPLAETAGAEVLEAALAMLANQVNALRIGPVYDDDPAAGPLIEAARARGWVALERTIAQTFLLDMAALSAERTWPRASTLRKNRYHEKQLAALGRLDCKFLSASDWPYACETLAIIERASWISERTSGADAKFTASGHGIFWRALAEDAALAEMMRGALLSIGGKPAAFSFDLEVGALRYAIANSYDPAFAKHSPGKSLYYRNLANAMKNGTRVIDWGAGDSGYKSVIGATPGPMIRDWLLLRPGLPSRLAPLIKLMWRGR